MKQLGVALAGIGALVLVLSLLNLRGTYWDYVWYLAAMVAFFVIRMPKEMAHMRLHWKITLAYAAISSFATLFVILQQLAGLDFNLSLAATFIGGGFVFLLLDKLDENAANRTPAKEEEPPISKIR